MEYLFCIKCHLDERYFSLARLKYLLEIAPKRDWEVDGSEESLQIPFFPRDSFDIEIRPGKEENLILRFNEGNIENCSKYVEKALKCVKLCLEKKCGKDVLEILK